MGIDPISLDILWNRLIATVNEQAAALMRSSFTSIVREAGDLSAGVFDRRGRMIAQAVTGTPGHINSMATAMGHFLDQYPLEDIRPGDVFVTNDPWKTASQLNDITIVTPVFRKGRLIAFFGNCCHALDIGGRGLAADSRSVFEEGLQIPIMKLVDQGKQNETLLSLLKANVRTPDEVMGDIHSQIVGNEVGATQLLSFLDELELADIEEISDAIVSRSENAMRERIAALEDGTYRYGFEIDGLEHPLELICAVIVEGDRITVDFGGSSDGVDKGINVCLNYTRAYATYGIKCAISPDIPNNEGSFRPVTVTAPEGSILNARYPRAVGGRHLVGHFLPSLIMGALSQALPERVMAPGFDALWDTHLAGHDPRVGEEFSFTWFASGGTGALNGADGLSATAYPSGIAGVAVEVMESLAPIMFECRELVPDSGGAGQYRGGLGQRMRFRVVTGEPYLFSGLYDRISNPPPGLFGGEPGKPGSLEGSGAVPLVAKTSRMVESQTVVELRLPGGGGYGPVEKREPDAIASDIVDGYITQDGFERDYRVSPVFDEPLSKT